MDKPGIKEYYNDTIHYYDDMWSQNDFMMPYLKEFKKLLGDNARVLDLGCNSGYETERMALLGTNMVGLDFSDGCIELAKTKYKSIEFVVDDMLNDLSYLGKFDGVMAITSLIHIEESKLLNLFTGIYNNLNDDGIVFLVNHVGDGLIGNRSVVFQNKEYDRPIYGHSNEIICLITKELFEKVSEPIGDDTWNYLILRKKTI